MNSLPTEIGTGSNGLPTTLAGFRDFHAGETIIVCGCGVSLNELPTPERFITIGVNDVGRRFDPTYLVVLNNRCQFKRDRFHYVEDSRARAVFSQLDLGIPHPHPIRFRLGRLGGTDFSDPNVLHYTRNSPYVALCLAVHLGARRIGVIGVDFTDHHFFGQTGRHPLAGQFQRIDEEYRRLAAACTALGVEVVNLSRCSRLTAFPKMRPDEFVMGRKREPRAAAGLASLRIVSYSTTPVAGVPAILARCIDSQTPHVSECIWAADRYANGVTFQGGVQWRGQPHRAREHLDAADIVIVHNGRVAPEHRAVLAGKPVVTMAHNYLWNVDPVFVNQGYPGVVVGQYQATLPEFRAWGVVPNPVPLWEPDYEINAKPSIITISYTPSGKHESYPAGHRLYWHSKGYNTTMRILERLARQYPIRLEVITSRQLPHREILAMKQRSHIVIDECVTGSYHRNSLEGLALGCVVVNGIGLLPGVTEVLRQCAGNDDALPFVSASLGTLESVLTELIESGQSALQQRGAANRTWMEQNWAFAQQWDQFWLPVMDKALAASRPTLVASATAARVVVNDYTTCTRQMHSNCPPQEQKETASAWLNEKTVASRCRIPLYAMGRNTRRGNFGDLLSPVIIQALTRQQIVNASTGARLFAIGSLLKFAHHGDLVWGSGFIDETDTCSPGVHVCAVRGPLTRRKLLHLGIECPEIYGDPALLLPWVRSLPLGEPNGIGIIPHYVDAALVRAAVRDRSIRIIDIRAGIDSVFAAASRCELLLSSSLHGCVLGDALGKPTAWVRISDKVVGNGFKFHDYYAGTGRDPLCADWRSRIHLDEAVNLALKVRPPDIDLQRLVESFPFSDGSVRGLADLPHDGAAVRDVNSGRPLAYFPRKDLNVRASQKGEAPVEPVAATVAATIPQGIDPRLAIFSAGDEHYVPCMVTSLRSFMQENRDRPFDYFILGRAFTTPALNLLARYGIRYVELDLHAVFPRRPEHRYPSECFWIFKGPELFHDMGYSYSLSVDGDTWCNRRLDLDWLPRLTHLAGIDRGTTVEGFLANLGQYGSLAQLFGIAPRGARRTATNTGVLFYNNATLKEIGFFERIVDVFGRSEAAGILRGGDDSTLALLMAVHPELELLVLDEVWNAYRGLQRRFNPQDPRYAEHLVHWINEARIVHFGGVKPWGRLSSHPNRVNAYFCSEWQKLWRSSTVTPGYESRRQPTHRPRFSGPRRGKALGASEFPALSWWYRGGKPNLGDECAPYLLRKIATLPSDVRLRERPQDPRTVDEAVLLSVGSILRLCGPNAVVWGSGIRNIDQDVANAARFCAVRGPLTRRRLLQLGYDCPAVYGDPALLLPRYFAPTTKKRYRLGIIPHLVDAGKLSQLYGRQPDILIIDAATTNVEGFIEQVLSCEHTVSSALHGLVVSIAYGIPTRWLKYSERICGDDSKFYDFFASLNETVAEQIDPMRCALSRDHRELEPYTPIRMGCRPIPCDDLITMTFRHDLSVDLDQLLEACPIGRLGWKPGFRTQAGRVSG